MSKLHLLIPLIFFSITTYAQKKSAWYAASDLGLIVSHYKESSALETTIRSVGWTNTLGAGREYFLGQKSSVSAEALLQYNKITSRTIRSYNVLFVGNPVDRDPEPIRISLDSLLNRTSSIVNNYSLGLAIPIFYKYSLKKIEIGGGVRANFPLVYPKDQGTILDHMELGYQLLMTCKLNDNFKIRTLSYNSLGGIKNKSTGQLFLGLIYHW